MDFNKEKQIEEMAIDLAENIVEVWNNNWSRYVFDCKATAENMIKEGYCRQKEGEWLPKEIMIRTITAKNYTCSICGYENGTTPFCPNCGAKMKGNN